MRHGKAGADDGGRDLLAPLHCGGQCGAVGDQLGGQQIDQMLKRFGLAQRFGAVGQLAQGKMVVGQSVGQSQLRQRGGARAHQRLTQLPAPAGKGHVGELGIAPFNLQLAEIAGLGGEGQQGELVACGNGLTPGEVGAADGGFEHPRQPVQLLGLGDAQPLLAVEGDFAGQHQAGIGRALSTALASSSTVSSLT